MKHMKLKLTNALVAAALMAASVPAFATMSGATSGNGELLLNLRYYTGAGNSGGDDISAVFDLGVTMNDFLANINTAGFTQSWDLTSANYGDAFNTVLSFVDGLGGSYANIEYNVIALDNTGSGSAGGHRYLTTAAVNAFPALTNSGLANFTGMDKYVTDNNVRGTHASEVNGASTAVQADSSSVNQVYFGAVNGPAGDTWRGATTQDTTAKIGVEQNFWFLTTSSLTTSAQSTKTAFGYNWDGTGAATGTNGNVFNGISATGANGNEFGKWRFALDANGNPLGTIAFANPVPEASTYAMMLAGLGLMGFIGGRRRLNRTVA